MKARKGRDPVFALIETHRSALKAFERATASLDSLKAKLDARPAEQRRHESRRLTCAVPLFDLGGRKWDLAKVVRSREEIALHVWDAFESVTNKLGRGRTVSRISKFEREAVIEVQRRYDTFQRAHRARRKACGLTAREEAAWKAELAAMKALTQANPTPEGRVALATYFASPTPRTGALVGDAGGDGVHRRSGLTLREKIFPDRSAPGASGGPIAR